MAFFVEPALRAVYSPGGIGGIGGGPSGLHAPSQRKGYRMATEQELEDLADKVSSLFQGLDLEEVANILKMQLIMLVTQGAEDIDEATEFLEEITEDVEEMIRQFPFDEEVEAEDETTPPAN